MRNFIALILAIIAIVLILNGLFCGNAINFFRGIIIYFVAAIVSPSSAGGNGCGRPKGPIYRV